MIQSIDDFLLAAIPRGAFGDAVMPFITRLGDMGFIWIIITVALLLCKKTRYYGIISACSLLLSLFLGQYGLKLIFQRERPFYNLPGMLLLIPPPGDYSFPSGHAASSFAAAAAIFYWNRKAGLAAFVLAFLIAFSRLYLFVHYPSDVLAGALLGLGCTLFVVFVVKKLTKAKI